MDDDYTPPDPGELIAQLCLEAGRIMEDTSGELALKLPDDHRARGARLGMAREAAKDILALTAAGHALHRRLVDQG